MLLNSLVLQIFFWIEIQKSQELPVTAYTSPSWHRLQHHNTVTVLTTGRRGHGDVTAWQISPMPHLHQLQCDYNTGGILISYFVLSREVPWHSDWEHGLWNQTTWAWVWAPHSLSVWSQSNNLTSLCFNFLTCQMKRAVLPTWLIS